jgi:predicted HTH domain antitoxin
MIKMMKTAEIKFEISENLLNSLNQNKKEFTEQLRLLTALQLLKNHKLSFGQAAELAGMKREYFLVELDKHGIDFIDYDPVELKEELEKF